MKILVIEDDRDIAELVDFNLKQEKFRSEVVGNGRAGLEKAKKWEPDLVILDLMLPEMGGLDVCKALKSDPKTQNIPVIMLTAKATEIDRVLGLELGADDYITKPFSPRELMLRVKTILRRSQKNKQPFATGAITFGDIRVDADRFEVLVKNKKVQLTAIEFKLLQYLLATRGRVATRDALLDHVWGYDAALTTRTVDTHIKRLRHKLGGAANYVETIRGIGYRMIESA